MLEVDRGITKATFEAENISSQLYFFDITSIALSTEAPNWSLDMFDNVNISLSDASFATFSFNFKKNDISSGSGNIALSNEGVVYFDANGFVNEAVLENENFWIAEIPETNFEISSELGAITPKKIPHIASYTRFWWQNPVSSASIGSDIDFRGYDVAQCLRSICSEITHKINYELDVSNEKN